ncbi:hypothetical protein WA538_001266 [Blastocystis sp. DL]
MGIPDATAVTLAIRGSQVSTLLSVMQKVDTQFVLPSSLDINEVMVPAKYRIELIEGYDLSRCRCETVKDILFLLRHRDCFYLTFVLSIPITPSVPAATYISISQCILFLLPNYSLYLPQNRSGCRKCRRSVIRNHCISLQVLNRFNPSLSLSRLLCPFDLEHLFIADHLFLQAIASLLPTPLISSEQIADFYQGQEQDPFFRPSLGAIRLLLEDSIHSLPELSLLIRFAAAVFSRHHIFPSVEWVSRLLAVPDPLLASALVRNSLFLLHDARQSDLVDGVASAAGSVS